MKKTNGWLMVASVAVAAVCLSLSPVPGQAVVVDLTAAGSTGTINGALFVQVDPQSTGSGVIDPFVRIGGPVDSVQGYNTSGRPLQYDENSSPVFTHDLLLSTVPIVNVNNTNYYQFLLDINQTGVDPLLSLDQIKIYQGTTGGLHSNFPTGFGTLVYDLDAGADSWINLNYNLNTGSGSGDMFAYIPTSAFGTDPYVYFFSQFGTNNNNNDGFEEWAVLKGATSVPEAGALLMFGTGLIGLVGYRRLRRMQ